MKVLGIETSCDETAAAVVELGDLSAGATLHSNSVASSLTLHSKYGGVIPELAARSQITSMQPVIADALEVARCTWDDIDAIAVTHGAGLGGSLLVGVMTARTLAITHNKPLYAINHVEAHMYASFITHSKVEGATYQLPEQIPAFPLLGLIVSGNHTQLVLWQDHFNYTLLGLTHDDAIGEAFDKVAKILGLPYPGGPSVSKLATQGDIRAYQLPKSKMPLRANAGTRHSYDFSFSGLKTAVLRAAQASIGEGHEFHSSGLAERLSEAQKANIAASFQHTAIETVVDKAVLAFEEFSPAAITIGGGVASSPVLRQYLADRLPIAPIYTDNKLYTDNAAMVGALGCYMHALQRPPADPYTLAISPSLSM